MRQARVGGRLTGWGWSWFGAGIMLTAMGSLAIGASRKHKMTGTVSHEYAEARALFEKTWESKASAPGGDGLGPLFNATSCVACHNLGGVGGAGGGENNVRILTAFAGPVLADRGDHVFKGELEDLHPGFKNRTSVVLHRKATSWEDERRLAKINSYSTVQSRDELIALRTSARNTPALFGAGMINAIADDVLIAAENRKSPAFPEIKGRVSRLRDGRLGRFGWKGQTASLSEFVLTACSNELGLEVPGHHQVTLDSAKTFDATTLKLDMDEDECQLLIRYVSSLPRPRFIPVDNGTMALRGRGVFAAIGCATCHAPILGHVDGLFSDLLLHDLGDRFMDSAGGYGSSGGRKLVADRADKTTATTSTGEAGPTEWRTPPLWGVVDSAPYLHDGRAPTLDDAIRLHGGEADKTVKRYTQLAPVDRQCLLAFLHSLTAPRRPRPLSESVVRKPRGVAHRS